MFKKSISIGIIVLFLFCNISFTTLSDENTCNVSGKTLNKVIYVDDDNVEGPWHGTEEFPYQFIQDAVDNASYGGTIFVYNGTYYENLVIDKYLELYGENRENTIIDGHEKGWVVRVFAQVTISGFTIMSSNDDEYLYNKGLRIKKSDYNRISNNIIKDNYYGLYLIDSDYNNISNNIIINQWFQGILLEHSSYNTIWKNTIKDNYWGLDVEGGEKNIIVRNFIINNLDGLGVFSANNYFYNNHIWDNERYDIVIINSINNEFICNNIEDGIDKSKGILFWESKIISENSDNYWDGNYWGRSYWFNVRNLPKIIFNLNTFELDIDWHPAPTKYYFSISGVR